MRNGFLAIEHLRFIAGPRPGLPPTEIDCSSVVVIVGPNGSGKTRALRDIQYLARSRPVQATRVVESAAFEILASADTALAFVARFEIPEPKGSLRLAHMVLTLPVGRDEHGEDWD